MSNSSNRVLRTDYLNGLGSGNKNYITNPSAFRNSTEQTTVSGLTLTRNTSSPLTAISDFKAVSSGAQSVTWGNFTLDNGDLNGNFEFSGAYTLSITSGTVTAIVSQNSVDVASLVLTAAASPTRFSIQLTSGSGAGTTNVRFAFTGTATLNVANLYYGRDLRAGITPGAGSGLVSQIPGVAKTSDYAIVSSDNGGVILVDTTSGLVNITLPLPSLNGRYTIKDATGQSATNPINILRNGSELIDNGAGNDVINTPFQAVSYVSDGTNWLRVAIYNGSSVAGRAVFAGGNTGSASNVIDYVSIPTLSSATSFGTLTQSRYGMAAASSSSRGVFAGGNTGSADQSTMDYITIASAGNATSFGALASSRFAPSGANNSTRCLFAGNDTGPSAVCDYITTATTGNGTNFGNLTSARGRAAGMCSTTRAVFAGGSGNSAIMDYYTTATLSTATSFGSQVANRTDPGGCSNATRGVMAGGDSNTQISYITIATTSNDSVFGTLAATRAPGAASNQSRALFAGGTTSSTSITYVTIASTSNDTTFGSLTTGRTCNGLSNANGGF